MKNIKGDAHYGERKSRGHYGLLKHGDEFIIKTKKENKEI